MDPRLWDSAFWNAWLEGNFERRRALVDCRVSPAPASGRQPGDSGHVHALSCSKVQSASVRGVVSAGIAITETPELKQVQTVGIAICVGFFFSFRLFIMLLSVRVLGTDPQTGVATSLVLNILLLVAVAFYSLGEVRYPVSRMARLWPVRWAFAFLLFSCCSLFWTSTASLPAAIAYWCAMAADVAIVILILRAGRLKEVASSLMKGYVWGAC